MMTNPLAASQKSDRQDAGQCGPGMSVRATAGARRRGQVKADDRRATERQVRAPLKELHVARTRRRAEWPA